MLGFRLVDFSNGGKPSGSGAFNLGLRAGQAGVRLGELTQRSLRGGEVTLREIDVSSCRRWCVVGDLPGDSQQVDFITVGVTTGG